MHRDFLPTSPALEVGGTFGPASGEPLTFVVMGDSTAAGVGAGDAEHAYPTLLAQRLAAKGRRVRLVDLGVSGARVADVLERAGAAVNAQPDLLFVGIGANDATHLTSLASIRRDMAELLDRVAAGGARVVVAGAPDMRAAAFLEPLRSIVGWRGRSVAAAIEEVARSKGVAVVPLAEKTAPFFVEDPDRYYSSDDFHPSAAGYARWADAIYPVLESALEGEGP